MARKKRETSQTGIYHILLRGVNSLFLSDSDFETFLSILKEKTKPNKVKVLSYLLLENRVHMIIDVKGASVGTVLKPICTSYARYCNRTRALSGKLFYDRFKSEPINTKEELLGAVSFVNFIAKGHKNSKFSSLENPICPAKASGLSEKQLKSTELTRMFMEDYDCLSKDELIGYIYAFCGVNPKEFRALPDEKKREIIDKIAECRMISKSKIYEALGVKKSQKKKAVNTAKNSEEKPEVTDAKKPKKKDLSVWLL